MNDKNRQTLTLTTRFGAEMFSPGMKVKVVYSYRYKSVFLSSKRVGKPFPMLLNHYKFFHYNDERNENLWPMAIFRLNILN